MTDEDQIIVIIIIIIINVGIKLPQNSKAYSLQARSLSATKLHPY